MNSFSISQLAQLSGIRAHTIRMWEKRYNALSPQRSGGNTRYYNNEQLRRLLNIVALKGQNYHLPGLCAMSNEELFVLAGKEVAAESSSGDEYFVTQLIDAGIRYDEAGFNHAFSHCLLRFGLRDTYLRVVYPLLVRVGILWARDRLRPSYEHFISKLIRQKLFTAIDSLPPAQITAPRWLLFLPENEFHEIGLLMADFLLHQAGIQTVYLGANTPEEGIAAAVKEAQTSHMLLFWVRRHVPEAIGHYLTRLTNSCKPAKILVAMDPGLAGSISLPEGIRLLPSVIELENYIANK